jgi:Cd2+/Zn2+-exporting ATPase
MQDKIKTRFFVKGMDCASCAFKIEHALKRIDGADDIHVNVSAGWVSVTGEIDTAQAAKSIQKLGYKVTPEKSNQHHHDHADHDVHDHAHADPLDDGKAWWQTGKGRLVILSAALIIAAMVIKYIMPQWREWPFVVATVVALLPVAKRAFAAARSGSIFTIEMMITIAAMGAIAIHTVEEAAIVVFLFLVGELLEGVTASRARQSIRALGDLTPKNAIVIDNGVSVETDVADLTPGQIVLVRAGDRIPCDGRIVQGDTDVDEAPVTGESNPVSKKAGDDVFAGTINLSGTLHVEVTRATADNTISRIIALVDEAQGSKAPVQRFVDRFARIYMPVIVVMALLVAIIPPVFAGQGWDVWTYRALALLLIACPCALVISTPAAIAAGMSAGARRGLLIKGGAVLESLGAVKTIAFDKTGTLTEGKPSLTDVVGFARSEDDVLRLIAAMEQSSSHPIAYAVIQEAAARSVTYPVATDTQTLSGKGMQAVIEGQTWFILNPREAHQQLMMTQEMVDLVATLEDQGKTVALLLNNQDYAGLFAVRDEPRSDAQAAIKTLSDMGIASVMLTGDNQRAAKAVATIMGMDVRAELMPEDKARIIHELDEAGRGPVAKVGDGINDAPALAAAHVGIAMGAGTGVALETADAALLRNNVEGVVELVRLSRATLHNIRTNIALALGSKAIFLVTTILGMTGMWIAVMADTGATVLVTLNAMRLLRFRPSKSMPSKSDKA